ncbi:hypothetical protein LCGC14_1201260 [marine sediment metagenome]|uniref:Uncharacterized protein n=1 Tax=marine sediment metagenome TaxID=412755 RepID=A0A0F9PLK9_9ZZZZ
MVEANRPTGRVESATVDVETGIDEGTICPGCEKPVTEETGVGCYCEAEGYSRQHETWLWCSTECQDKTHEIPYYAP